MEATFAFLWHPKAPNDIHWHIRAIRSDGTFYGEARSSRTATLVQGRIPSSDWNRCRTVLDKIAFGSPIATNEQWSARIIRWRSSLADAEVVFGYMHGDEERFAAAKLFLELKTLLEKQISQFYPEIA